MSKLKWDRDWWTSILRLVWSRRAFVPGKWTYEKGVAWNGLSKVSESPSGQEATPLYANNHKYLNHNSTESMQEQLKHIHIRTNLPKCMVESEMLKGVTIGRSRRDSHSAFAYRTLIGNDTDGTSHGYKIHLVYGALLLQVLRNMNLQTQDQM